jgi:hypothetical protein
MRKLWLVLPLVLMGSGGGNDVTTTTPATQQPAPAATPTATPTPTPISDATLGYSGTYSGQLVFNFQGGPEYPVPASIEVAQGGNELKFGPIVVPGWGEFPLKSATLTSKTEFAGNGYQPVGCGRVKVSTDSSFTGRKMALTAGLTSDAFTAAAAESSPGSRHPGGGRRALARPPPPAT